MKHLRKVMTLVLAALCALAVATPAWASDYKITVTNTNDSISIAGKTYTAYKLFDATYSGNAVSYTIAQNSNAYTNSNVKGILDQYFTFTAAAGDSTIMVVTPKDGFNDAKARELADKLQPYLSALATAGSGTVAAGAETVDIDTGAAGYFIVDGTADPNAEGATGEIVAALALTTAKPTATVNPKADGPSVDKKITKIANGTNKVESDGKTGNGSVGDKVEYKLESKVPDMTGYKAYSFVYTDTMSKGLTFNNDVVVTIDGTAVSTTASSDATSYAVTTAAGANDSTVVTITFANFIKQAANEGKDIVITYSATINQDAATSGHENNTVTLKYSNNPYDSKNGTGQEVMGETPKSKTDVYDTNIQLTKVDGATKLTGAKFKIEGNSNNVQIVNSEIYKESAQGTWYRLKDGTYTETASTDATADQYESTTQKYEKVTTITKDNVTDTYVAEGWVKSDSTLSFNGLGEGTYTITELVAPDGYNLLKDAITVTVTFDATNKVFTAKVGSDDATVENNVIKFDVQNNKGTELPSTGGMGTTILYTVGGILIAAGGIWLATKKRLSTME